MFTILTLQAFPCSKIALLQYCAKVVSTNDRQPSKEPILNCILGHFVTLILPQRQNMCSHLGLLFCQW